MATPNDTAFEQQLATSLFHSSCSWHRENEIVKALKIAQEDENKYDEAVGLEMLGDIYFERSLKESDGFSLFDRLDDLILATALYNSSHVRTMFDSKKSELKTKLRQIEEELLNLSGHTITQMDFQFDVERNHKATLDEFRANCRERLKAMQASYTIFRSPLHEVDKESEMSRANHVENLFVEIKLFIKEFVGILLGECVEALGDPPDGVGFAFIGFGSFARCEMTPYSDVECGILVDDDNPKVKDYFMKLTQYLNYKVLNLQETILPSMCIPSLNDNNNRVGSLKRYSCTALTCPTPDTSTTSQENPTESPSGPTPSHYGATSNEGDPTSTEGGPTSTEGDPTTPQNAATVSEDDPTASESDPTASRDVSSEQTEPYNWFYDNEMRGLSMDGRMNKACKLPLGWLVQRKQGEETIDLIKTPSNMAFLYCNSLLAKGQNERQVNEFNLSTVLANVSFIYGNDESLVDTYNAIVFSMTEDNRTPNARQTSAIGCLEDALHIFEFSLNASDIGLISSVKQKLYRVIDMLLLNLGKLEYASVVENTPWNILDRFLETNLLSSQAYQNLKVIASIANEVRLTKYLRSGRQDEIFSFFDQATDIDYELARDFFVRFFYTVFPFQRAVKKLVSRISNQSSVVHVHFPPEEIFYEYSHLKSAIALSLTSYNQYDQTMWKFSEAFASTDDENTRRICLAFLSCLHPDYSTRYCEKILEVTTNNENSSDWRIFSFLIGCLASFHNDDIDKVEAFFSAANTELSHYRPGSSTGMSHNATEVIVQSYNILIQGFLEFRQQNYENAIAHFDEAREKYLTIPYSRENPEKARSKSSLFVQGCVFMKGRCHLELGNLDDPHIEIAMRAGRVYTGNGHFMRILYHAYVGTVSVGTDGSDNEIFSKHAEKALELYLRFECPLGQERWVSIVTQGVILATLFLGVFYREGNRIEDALRIFKFGTAKIVPKSLGFCDKKYHVGTKKIEAVATCVDAFTAIFKLLEAECLYALNRHDAMWTTIGEAMEILARYRGKLPPVDIRDVQSAMTARQSAQQRTDPGIWQRSIPTSVAPAPRLVDDTNQMAFTLEKWCDSLTIAMQYTLYIMERDIHSMIVEKANPIITFVAALLSMPNLPIAFQSNPCQILHQFLQFFRHNPKAIEIIGAIFNVANNQRKSVFEMITKNVAESQNYAAEFTDEWMEIMLLYLRLSLCHDLVSASGLLR